jgi:hypothetical protein
MSHVWRPLIVVAIMVTLLLIVRSLVVPSDFMAKNGDYKYQWHRVGNEKEWENFPVKYKGRFFCGQCHVIKSQIISGSKHARIECENCHVQATKEKASHPVDLKEAFGYGLYIGVDRSRSLCLRCHAKLPYRPKTYAGLATGTIPFKMQDPEAHNTGLECVTCHDVHSAGFKTGE